LAPGRTRARSRALKVLNRAGIIAELEFAQAQPSEGGSMARIQLAGTVEVPVNRFRELVRSGRIDCRQTIPATGEVAYLVSLHVIGVDLPRETDLTLILTTARTAGLSSGRATRP